jgi:hypothetical protein
MIFSFWNTVELNATSCPSLLAGSGTRAVRDNSRAAIVARALTLYEPAFFCRCKPLDSITVEK